MAELEDEAASVVAAEEQPHEQDFQEREGHLQELMFDEGKNYRNLEKRWTERVLDIERVKMELESVRAQKKERMLDPDAQRMIRDIATETIDEFVVRRKCREDEVIYVDVHFEPGFERTGMSLRVGGEGAGSADAKFRVRLDDHVSSLAKQAAKYWGLDHTKVFFLDRDGRIVPDTMRLSDVVLPPRQSSAASSHSDTQLHPGASSSDVLVRHGEGEVGSGVQEVIQVKERNYSLTLVRAGTVLQKEDLISPEGEKWHDFTFNQRELQQDLETTRKKQGDGAVQDPVEITTIPNLYDLIEDGKKLKRKKRKDLIFRVIEFGLFSVGFILYYGLLEPNDMNVHVQLLITRGLSRDFLNFTNKERDAHGLAHFEDVRTEYDFGRWLEGPLQRSLVTDALPSRNLYVLAAVGFIYPDVPYEADASIDFCSTEGAIGSCIPDDSTNDDPTPAPTAGSTSNETDTTTTTMVTTTATETTTTFTGTVTSTTEIAVSPTGCVPKILESCMNTRVIQVYEDALLKCEYVPECRSTSLLSSLQFIGRRFVQADFSSISGFVRLHTNPERVHFDISNRTTFLSTVQEFQNSGPDFNAKSVLLAVYSPTQDTFFMVRANVERTAGSLIASSRTETIPMGRHLAAKYALFSIIFFLTVACFVLEVRRITSCPGMLRVEEEREAFNCWTCCFLLLPLFILAGLCVLVLKATWRTESVVMLDGNQLADSSFDDINGLQGIHTLEEVLTVWILVIFNSLFFRYLLMYFPELNFISTGVRKMAKPMLFTLLIMSVCMVGFWLILYTTYSSAFSDFRNHVVSAIQVFLFVQGYFQAFQNWWAMYEYAPTMFTFVAISGFLTMSLMVNNLAIAIFVSHEKEKDLYENSQYHPAWQSERRSDDFNPALVGWKFREGKDPVKPEPHQR